ncbi:thiol-disulfide oxidoreductase DCC family protein [Bacillus niameyensis]|uniref:thiol-disulfide oxidoreductase DCC family protein n=1 Tax=Bacillus niameyensis TaxID=1522308 RepID=UPI00078646F9|nr:thiol-disulfide oxidoreductase DCC family protein [Bacillus niameyensis]
MEPIIFFDGECHFCQASVQFIIKRDSNGYFHFTSLQGEFGQRLLKKANANLSIDSLVLHENDQVYYKSTAALRICKHLNGFWKLLYPLILVPAPIRNLLYDFIARNRYKWFGKNDTCMLPNPKIRKRFLS